MQKMLYIEFIFLITKKKNSECSTKLYFMPRIDSPLVLWFEMAKARRDKE